MEPGLFCFDSDGGTRWKFHYGRSLVSNGRSFTSVYIGDIILSIRDCVSGYLLTVSHNIPYFPAQVALLDPTDGRLLDEYWHPGWLRASATADLDGDGIEEVLLGGVNNPGPGIGHAVLVVLRVPFDSPKKTQLSNYYGSGNAKEFGYVIFPTFDVLGVETQSAFVHLIDVVNRDRIMVEVGQRGTDRTGYYSLNSRLEVVEFHPSDGLVRAHSRMHLEGTLDHPLNEGEIESWAQARVLPTAVNGNALQAELRIE